MRKTMLVLFALALFAIFPFAIQAEEPGRPDPTGQGRYMQFGQEVPYGDAHVAKKLPAGAKCATAGEMIGVRVWNSTREGFAILSELSDKAKVAVAPDGRIFLCECADGYNQLFRLPAPTPAPQAEIRETRTELTRNDLMEAIREAGRFRPEPRIEVRPWHDPCTRTRTRKFVCSAVAIGLGIAAGNAISGDEENKGCSYCNY